MRLTADETAVICHDSRFRGIEIASALSRQLGELPRLEEVLARYQGSAFLDIELKAVGLESKAASLIRELPPRRGFVVSSFLPDVLYALHAENSGIPLGLICETHDQLGLWTDLPVEYVIPQYKLVTSELVLQLEKAGKKVLVWTVNDPAQMISFRDLGVDGIIADDTNLLCRTLSGGGNTRIS